MQAALLLVWTVAERFSALLFGPALEPTERVRRLGQWHPFKEAFAVAEVKSGRRVVDSRNLDAVQLKSDGSNAWSYWYQVRSNLSHRGKGANRDADIVREALVDVHDVLRVMIWKDVNDIEPQWDEADPDGEEYDWLLRRRFTWARRVI